MSEPEREARLEADVDAIRCALGLFRNTIRPGNKMDREEYDAAQIGVNNLLAEIAGLRAALVATERGADDLQGEVDELADWQRRVCELLTPEGDRGALFSDLAEARINELLRIERAADSMAGAPVPAVDPAKRS